jgi:hypothetical protein
MVVMETVIPTERISKIKRERTKTAGMECKKRIG